IFLSFIVLYAYQAFFVKPVPKPAQSTTSTAATKAAATPGATTKPAQSSPTAPVPATPAAAALVSDSIEREIRVETRDVVATFTNRGARLKSWRLKKYLDQSSRQPQELIENQLPGQPLPFTLSSTDTTLDTTLNNSLYAVNGAPSGTIASPLDLKFE